MKIGGIGAFVASIKRKKYATLRDRWSADTIWNVGILPSSVTSTHWYKNTCGWYVLSRLMIPPVASMICMNSEFSRQRAVYICNCPGHQYMQLVFKTATWCMHPTYLPCSALFNKFNAGLENSRPYLVSSLWSLALRMTALVGKISQFLSPNLFIPAASLRPQVTASFAHWLGS